MVADSVLCAQDALKFPMIGSVVLFSLYIAFRVFPKDIVNMILTVYFVVLGALALTACIAPFVAKFFPESSREKEWKGSLKIPFVKVRNTRSFLKQMCWIIIGFLLGQVLLYGLRP